MPINLWGIKPPPGSGQTRLSGDNLVTTQSAIPAIQTNRWARNGKHPNAVLMSMMAQHCNHAAMMRTKQVFVWPGTFGADVASGAGDRGRWVWAFHSGPYAQALVVVAVIQPAATASQAPYARLDVTPLAGGTTLSANFNPGLNVGTTGMSRFRVIRQPILISPDTDYTAQFFDGNGAILQTCCVYELASLTQNYGGYIPENFAVTGNIYAEDRQHIAEVSRALWKRGGAQLINFSANIQSAPIGTTSANWLNVGDQVSTTPTANTPGYVLDMRGKARLSQRTTGVPVVFAVNGALPGAGGPGGHVRLVDASGNVIVSSDGAFSGFGTPTWVTMTANIPATQAKYDLQFKSDGTNTFNLNGVSCYEYEA